jgi:hypothetical protein
MLHGQQNINIGLDLSKFGNRSAVGIIIVTGSVHLLFVTIRIELGRVPEHSQVNGNTKH